MHNEFKDFFLSKGYDENCDYRMLFELCRLDIIGASAVEEILDYCERNVTNSSYSLGIFAYLLLCLVSIVKMKLNAKYEGYIEPLSEEAKVSINKIKNGNINGLFSQIYNQEQFGY